MTALALLDELDDDERVGEASALTMEYVGPVAARFVQDRAYIRNLMGPFGSAKTTTCFQAIIWATMWQRPGRDGIRRSRGCITRATYGQLQDTVMKDWFEWFPKTRENWNGDRLEHRVHLSLPGFGDLLIEVLFRACEDRKKAEQIFKGMQLTWLYPNEIDTQDPSVLEFGLPRLGRYPPASKGGCAWYGLISDMNAPDIDNWTYDLLVNQDMKMSEEEIAFMRAKLGNDYRIAFHRQPGGLDPAAENLMNLSEGYYERLKIGKSKNWLKRFIDNEFGASRNGQPVYPEYIDDIFCAHEPIKPLPGLPVCMGIDGGSTPAIAFGQRDEHGTVHVIDELVVFSGDTETPLEKFSAEAFGKLAGEFWLERFAKRPFGGAWHDPAALDGDEYDDAWIRLFWRAFRKAVGDVAHGWKCRPAPVRGNRLPERLQAVQALLTVDGGRVKFRLSSTCRHLRRGFNNGYVITRTMFSNGQGRWKEEPLKNDYSHVHDALQYLCLGLTKRGASADGGAPRGAASRRASGGVRVAKGRFAAQASALAGGRR